MRVCIITSLYRPSTIAGGVTSVVSEHANELSLRGHRTTILTSNILSLRPLEFIDELNEMQGDVQILRFPATVLYPHFSLFFSRPMLRWLKEHAHKFDVFHIHYGRELFSLSATDLLLRLERKAFIQSHGMLNRRDGIRKVLDNLVIKRQLKKIRGAFVLQSHEDSILRQICPSVNTLLLPNGLRLQDLPSWQFAPQRSVKSILFLARLHPRKRVSLFLDAASALLASRTNVQFIIAGPDGGEEHVVQKKIDGDSTLSKKVKILGSVNHSDALDILAQSDVYVLPSKDEPFPMALLEALAVGCPSIITSGVHIAETLMLHDAVEICTPDSASLAAGVEKLLLDPRLSQERSQKGKKTVQELFTIEKVVQKLENYYFS